MARATRSRGALAKPFTKKAAPPVIKSVAQKLAVNKSSYKPAATKKGGDGISKSVRRALGDISNNNDDGTEAEEDFKSDQDSVADSVENDAVIKNTKKGRSDKAVVQSNADDNDDEEEDMSEPSDNDESDYEETTKKISKRDVKKSVPAKKTAVGKKEQAKRVRSSKNIGEESRSKVPRTKSPNATSTKAQIFEDQPKIRDKDFSNLIGLARKPEENPNFPGDDDFGGADWRCYGAVDY